MQYPRLGLHCFSLDIPLPRPDRVDAYLQWSQEKQRLRDKRRLEIGNSWEEWKQRKLSIEEQLDEDDGADAPSDNAQAEELKRILALDDATERLRVLCPVPNDLLSIWRTHPQDPLEVTTLAISAHLLARQDDKGGGVVSYISFPPWNGLWKRWRNA